MTHEHSECRKLLASLSEYVDGALDESICDVIEQHMDECVDCEIVVDTLRKTVELYRAISPAPPVPDDVRARLFLRLELADYLKDDSQNNAAPQPESIREDQSEKQS